MVKKMNTKKKKEDLFQEGMAYYEPTKMGSLIDDICLAVEKYPKSLTIRQALKRYWEEFNQKYI